MNIQYKDNFCILTSEQLQKFKLTLACNVFKVMLLQVVLDPILLKRLQKLVVSTYND